MPTVAQRNKDAGEKARRWMSLTADRHREHAETAGPGRYRGSVTAPHPGDEDLEVTFRATATTAPDAITAATAELRAGVARYFLNPRASAELLDTLRRQRPFELRQPPSHRIVASIVATAGYPPPTEEQVGLTAIAMPTGPHTCGQVADATIARLYPAAHPEQLALT